MSDVTVLLVLHGCNHQYIQLVTVAFEANLNNRPFVTLSVEIFQLVAYIQCDNFVSLDHPYLLSCLSGKRVVILPVC